MHYPTPPTTQRKFGTSWGELAYVCKKLHYWLRVRNSKFAAKRFIPRLQRLLKSLPKSRMAIIRAEGMALLHEFQRDIKNAIKWREREILLMQRLYDSITRSNHDQKTQDYILADRGRDVFEERKTILRQLLEKNERATQ